MTTHAPASVETGRTIRVGIDTGGTFTDVVALDEATGTLLTTKTPSTPGNPADGFMAGIEKVLALMGPAGHAGARVRAVSHGTTVATNQLLEGKVGRLGFVTTEGYEAILEIARQSVPDGYGNSYFWVKPDRIVPRHLVQGVGGRLDHRGAEIRPFDEPSAREVARWFRAQGVDTLGVCFLHSYANPDHEERMREVLGEEHPDAVVSISSEVLREYREYERSMTTLVDAAVKPTFSRYVRNIKERLDAFVTAAGESSSDGAPPEVPFHVMKSNGGVLSADEVVRQPITTVLSGPAAGALGAALVARVAGFDRVLTCDGGGTSTDVSVVIEGEPTLTTEGSVGSYPSKIPMIDVVTVGAGGGSVAWLSPEETLKVGPRSAGAEPGPLCYAKGGDEVTVTDAHVVLGRIPPHLLGGEIPLDVEAARRGVAALAERLGLSLEQAATGVLEISAWNQANALRQVTVKRGLDVRDFTLTTFGGSGSLLLCRLMDVLGIGTVLVPPDPGNVSAFGLLTVDVKNDEVQTHVALHEALAPTEVAAVYDDLAHRAATALAKEGFPPEDRRYRRTADLRYFGQAFEVRVPVPEGVLDRPVLDSVATAFHAEHRALYGYDFAGDPRQQVEWVNLRVSGVGPITRPEIRAEEPGHAEAPTTAGHRPVCFDAADGYVDTPVHWRPDLRAGTGRARAGRRGGVRLHGAGASGVRRPGRHVPQPRGDPGGDSMSGRRVPTQFPFGTLTADAGRSADPVLVEIVQGTLASVEMEVETAIARTSRSPMIRDAHDFRAGIHDRLLRKLTGRSYSALVHPVARDFPLAEMRPGDVFFHNDVYRSEGGIGHLPDLCVTVPVFADDRVVAFVQAFGHHDDIGGAVPGSMPSSATTVFEEGLMVPPIKLWEAGVPNRAALAIMTRNSRMPESLAADLDAECAACLMGARRLGELFDRYGVETVESCFDAVIDRTTQTYRREILAKIPVGTWVWEDYAEHDGVDPPRLHTQRITLTRTPPDDPEGERLVLDFDGTSPQAKGPINHCGDYSDGVFLKKWLAPILRNLADTPERMAELDVNEGVVPLIELRFPPPGTLLTPVFPAPTNARTFVILRLLGVLAGVLAKAVEGGMPADQETIRYTGVYGDDVDGRPYLMREVLGGGSGGRSYADGEDTIHVVPDSRNLPTEFTEARFPFVVERLGLAMDSGGPGEHRGGLGYEKHIRMLRDGHFMSIADRSILSCWGVHGGRAGRPFQVVIDAGGPHEREVDALADAEPVRAGETIRIRTTGGGGWGDPLARDPGLVVRDVLWRKVSPEAALADYGVVLTGGLGDVGGDGDSGGFDAAATSTMRRELVEARGGEAFFDRGPGFERLSGGHTTADVDRL